MVPISAHHSVFGFKRELAHVKNIYVTAILNVLNEKKMGHSEPQNK